MKALGEVATDLPWLSPCAGSLVALARNPTAAVWADVRSDPGGVLLLVRRETGPSSPPHRAFLSGSFRDPLVLETALGLLPQGGFVDWNQPALAPVYQICVRQARLAKSLAEIVKDCDPDCAWIGGLLAPLGWLAVCAADPGRAVSCLKHPSFLQNPSTIQQQLWGLDHTAIARRLSRRWRLPPWLAAIQGHLGLPVGIARTLGAEPFLFQVVQLAVALTQQEGGLGLAVGATLGELLAGLGLSPDQVDIVLAKTNREEHELAPVWEAPATLAWLPDLLKLAIENRRHTDAPLVERLQTEIDQLQKALEEQCAGEKERLQVLKLKALAEMAAGAGHEINNPLAVISGQAQYLLMNETDPGRAKALQTIVGQAHRIHQILSDLMQFARPSPPQRELVEVTGLIRETALSLQELADRHRVRLVCPEPPRAYHVHGDPAQMQTILRALLRNAIEAAPAEGWAGIHVERIGPGLNLVVEDNGQGPSVVAREHLFDPFYSGRTAGRGRGLGLSTAWRLARQHGGDVRFEGTTQGLTRFVLTLPVTESPPGPEALEPGPERNGVNGRHVVLS